ncbi:MAG: HlyD family efflux transporter periplasmic adaptor subunit [Candidatus Colwellbacteria bacterium]|nr:HlyD family efflux transporter periplasmic adaptor subunit [Candidatus Colwellbacteria bacterium]
MKIDIIPKTVIQTIRLHKKTAVIIVAVVALAIFGGVKIFGDGTTESKYVLAVAEKGTIVTSVTGSGQVSASSQVELSPKVSGDVVYVGVKVGDEVKKGDLIVRLDAKDALKSVRDAEISLQSAQIAYDKLIKPADEISIMQAKNNLSRSQESLLKAYDDGYDAVSNNFLSMPTIMTGLKDILHGKTIGGFEQENHDVYENMVYSYAPQVRNYEETALAKYQTAYDAYTKNLNDYKSSDRFGTKEEIRLLIEETYNTTRAISDAVKSSNDFLSFIKAEMNDKDIATPVFLTTDLANLSSYMTKTATSTSSLLSGKTSMTSAEISAEENAQKLADLQSGADDLDIASQNLSLQQRKNSLADANEKLANYYIRAPFDGVIAQMNIEDAASISSDSVSSGSSIATIVTKKKIAEISLNEVDIAKVKTGQKATLTFDAVDDLAITGEVAEVDAIGKTSQGVVSYSAKIAFDTQDDRIKSGMSVSVAIITEIKQDVLIVPSSAIKSQGGASYIQIAEGIASDAILDQNGMTLASLPKKAAIETGLESDEYTEIISGINNGDVVVIKTISGTSSKTTSTSSTTKTTNTTPSLITSGGPGGSGMMPR